MKPRPSRHPQGPQLADPRPPRFEDLYALDGERKRVLETGYLRLLFGGGLFLVAFLAISLRLFEVGVWNGGERESAQLPTPDLEVARADILDRNGVLLATSLATASLYADPQQIADPAGTAAKLVEILPDLSAAELTAKLSAKSRFVWIKRDLTPRQQYAVNRLGIPALAFQREERRVYPQSSLTAHVVGYTDVDNKGLAGIEQSFDDVLKSGQPVQLSLDLRVQHILHDELQRAITDFSAVGGAGMVLDANTGEILAMVSLPDFDPVNAGTATPDQRFNRATLGVYEMGSTFKIFNTAAALDSGVIGINDSVDASHPLRVAGFTISDFHPENRPLTVSEVIMYSSNIGSALIAQRIGTERQRKFMDSIGMLRRASIEIPEAGAPMYPADWRPINTMTIAYGHGIAVSALHLVTGVAAMVNGGMMRPATLIHRSLDQVTDGQRVIKAETSAEIRQLLRLVVEKGTGKKADVPGYFVGGKTGTADKLGSHGYVANARMASFVGVFPINAPRYVVLAMVDDPKPNASSYGYATGGWVAAPAVGRVIQRMAPLLGIPPQDQNDMPSETAALLVSARGTE
ncbi:peptidoglycan glycosyltransferase [Hypericibacter terrae]|uniref:Peptidoglycan glycosyltransferase n=1 Tax=Hypericibacter terrae TaxID=2602015 RepID=A0A5J6MEF5_9PROT|nr:penicillin-binding protein 2 [Hypericibacter terrae]QEX15844.1 peptidoglycan glycosyltransferase [Hypericibacter terrae]